MLLKSCGRCRKLIPYPKKYCDACTPVVEAERQERIKKSNTRYNRKRDPKYLRFYASSDWKRMSKARMQAAGYRCEECGRLAVEVHHVAPIQTPEGWERRLDWGNLKALCLDCHNRAHGRFGRRGGRSLKPINR